MTDRTRRTMLKAAGASTLAITAAGCLGGGDDETDDDGGSGVEVDPGTQILFRGEISGWQGKEPADIDGESNPTLILQEGETYEIGWDEGDGNEHNVEIRDENGDVVDDYETELTAEPGEDQILEIEATSEMAEYVCRPHESSMVGDIQVE